MFRIKICGVTNVADALAVVDAGADSIGLNFYPKSPRHIDTVTASTILQFVPPEVARVGVVVNESPESIQMLMAEIERSGAVGLNTIQLHGDENPGFLASVRAKYLIRA